MIRKRKHEDINETQQSDTVQFWDVDGGQVETSSRQNLMNFGLEPLEIHAGEEYMCDRHLEHFRKLLRSWKTSLLDKGDETMQELKAHSMQAADPLDQASNEEGFNLRMRTRDRERRLLRKIEDAINLIDSRDYGYCEECGVQIGIRRLEARPTATQCIDCKSISELRERVGR